MKRLLFVLLIAMVMIPVLGAQAVKGASGKATQVASSKPDVLTDSDIIKMSTAQLSDEAIIAVIHSEQRSVAFDVSTYALVTLKNAGVSDNVIEAVVQRNVASAASDLSKKSQMTPGLRLFFEGFELLMILGFVTAALIHP